MKGWRSWFDSGDGLELTATFIMCLPPLVLVTPPLLAAQLPDSYFYPVSLLGWVLLPGLTWLTAAPGWGQARLWFAAMAGDRLQRLSVADFCGLALLGPSRLPVVPGHDAGESVSGLAKRRRRRQVAHKSKSPAG